MSRYAQPRVMKRYAMKEHNTAVREERWRSLADTMLSGESILLKQAAERLGYKSSASLYPYVAGTYPLPVQFTIKRVGVTILLERTETP